MVHSTAKVINRRMSSNISFAMNLQSEEGHQAILKRIESEVKALENIRKYLHTVLKAGKDYSGSIGDGAATVIKYLEGSTSESSNGGGDSVAVKASLHILQEIQNVASNVKQNSESLQSKTLLKLNDLIIEKKQLIKTSAQYYQAIRHKLIQYDDLTSKLRSEYTKNFFVYETAKTRHDDNTSKGAGVKKCEESQCKVSRALRKLQIAHAEYVLCIKEANDYDRDFRTILFPGLLQMEQTCCEKEVVTWKDVMEQIWSQGPLFNHSMAKMKAFEFNKEYIELISSHKCQPQQSRGYKFERPDTDLKYDNSDDNAVLESNLIVNSTTIHFLREKLNNITKRWKACESQVEIKNSELINLIDESMEDLIKKCDVAKFRCEADRLNSLKMYLDSKVDEYYGNNCANTLNPNTLEDFDETVSVKSTSTIFTNASALSLRKGSSKLVTFLKNARKKTVTFQDENTRGVNSDVPEGSVSLTPSGERKSALKSSQRNRTSSQPLKINSPSGLTSDIEKTPETEIMDNNRITLLQKDWFHGVLPREDVVRLLVLDGDFLVRETIKNKESQFVLSVYWNGPKHFIVQTTKKGQFRFEGAIFATVKELVEHYMNEKIPITNRSGAIISIPVNKETWELNNDDVLLLDKIGKGNFGFVYKARHKGNLVAVKTCRVNLPDEQKKKFLQEGRILKQYDHPNIVRFIGICVQKQPIMIVMELAPGGSLLTHLKNKGKGLNSRDLTQMTFDAATGMKYLEQYGCIHRDLAARNCLLNDNLMVKISDFGMSREEEEYVVSEGLKQIPVKWTAPEALNYGKYTSLSDVWSFAILMWEIFSKGETPYLGMNNSKAREMIEAGYRMPAPDGMPDKVYQLQDQCWKYDPEQRPKFSQIYMILKNIIDEME